MDAKDATLLTQLCVANALAGQEMPWAIGPMSLEPNWPDDLKVGDLGILFTAKEIDGTPHGWTRLHEHAFYRFARSSLEPVIRLPTIGRIVTWRLPSV